MGIFLKLLLHPYPDYDDALRALEAAHKTCADAGIPAVIAWRDSVALQEWRKRAGAEKMVSDDEIRAARVWGSALMSARRTLRLPLHVQMQIDVVSTAPDELQMLHGPDRFTWRQRWLQLPPH